MKENFYHGMLLGLLRSQDSWLVKSNAETGEGYSDISIQAPERIGIVIELKYAEDGNLEGACAEALRQIEERKYAEGLKHRVMKKIFKYDIAFWVKECMFYVTLQNCNKCVTGKNISAQLQANVCSFLLRQIENARSEKSLPL